MFLQSHITQLTIAGTEHCATSLIRSSFNEKTALELRKNVHGMVTTAYPGCKQVRQIWQHPVSLKLGELQTGAKTTRMKTADCFHDISDIRLIVPPLLKADLPTSPCLLHVSAHLSPHHTPTFSPVSDRYRKCDQSLTYCVEIRIGGPQQFHLHKQLA
jgi:hypothetical protein